ncbi:unnamed protein product [Boreogadus saida]
MERVCDTAPSSRRGQLGQPSTEGIHGAGLSRGGPARALVAVAMRPKEEQCGFAVVVEVEDGWSQTPATGGASWLTPATVIRVNRRPGGGRLQLVERQPTALCSTQPSTPPPSPPPLHRAPPPSRAPPSRALQQSAGR